MTTLRERLAAKHRRRIVVPVVVAQPTEEAVQAATLALLDTGEDGRSQVVDDLRATSVVDVGFVAVDGRSFEAVASAHPSSDGADGGMDWGAALPVLAALCAEDESLRDDDAWRGLLESWSHGERLTLWGALLRLNTAAEAPHLPKG